MFSSLTARQRSGVAVVPIIRLIVPHTTQDTMSPYSINDERMDMLDKLNDIPLKGFQEM